MKKVKLKENVRVYGIGSYHDGENIREEFLEENYVGIGWNYEDAPDLHEYFKTLKVGAFGRQNIGIRGIGIITNNEIFYNRNHVTIGKTVEWLNVEEFNIAIPKGKNNVRANTLYREFHPEVVRQILNKIKA